jgi:hypothetical protein
MMPMMLMLIMMMLLVTTARQHPWPPPMLMDYPGRGMRRGQLGCHQLLQLLVLAQMLSQGLPVAEITVVADCPVVIVRGVLQTSLRRIVSD